MKKETKKIIEYFSRTTEEVFSEKEFEALLESGKPIRIKYGVDVTAPFLHTGHAVNLWMMRYLQDLGHKVVFLIGDYTTKIGDPTGRDKKRPVINDDQIKADTEKFIEQVKMVLRFDDPDLLEIRKNSEWFDKIPLAKFLELLQMVTHSKLISRDMFQKRIADGAEIYMHEMLYPILQGYDSVELESDLTIIGSDQLFNEMLGRFYQEKFGQKPQVVLTTKITPGLDGGAKQSKSLNNYIGLGHTPRDKFGKTMTLPDNLIVEYLRVYTDVSLDEIGEIEAKVTEDPIVWKKFLARKIVERYHGVEAGEAEEKWFNETFSAKKVPDDIPLVEVAKGRTFFEVVKDFYGDKESNSNIRRLFDQGAVSVNEEKVLKYDEVYECGSGDVFKIGKRTWFKVG